MFKEYKDDFIYSNLSIITESENTLKDYFSKEAFEKMSQAIDNIKDATLITWYENELNNSNNMSNSKSLNSIETTDDKLKDYVIKYTSYKDLKQDYNKSKSDTIKKMKMLEVAKDLARMHNSIIQEIATSASCEEEYNIWKKYI